ncbi:small acid-soluble spore protein H (minor) [Psychrobacillus insolitus]|uniref:Small, acid-soluble spore protein H n=2 Tax=Psychrobacillus insolitus TaxID=1461 RepID=A0A2W7MCI4_9BACI|nr:small acid-soluble spore protein H (minor) [Psychrobacillus insolitus]
MMNIQRAQEIAASPVLADVLCNGVPIYIQHVDESKGTARIYSLDEPENEQEVALADLIEQESRQIILPVNNYGTTDTI